MGSLISIFPDGSQRERQVEAVIQVPLLLSSISTYAIAMRQLC